jgi:rare lipoprotein A
VIVKINDRGPFHTNRIVDLSYTAALKLDYLGRGSSELLLERLLPADIEKMAESRKNPAVLATQQTARLPPPPSPVPVPVPPPVVAAAIKDDASLDALIQTKSAADVAGIAAAPVPVAVPAVTIAVAAVPAVVNTPNAASGFYLQFGAFGLRSNAEATFTHLQSKLAQLPDFEIVQQGTLYRLFSGPFASREDATNAIQMAINVGVPKPIIVQR